MNDFIDCLNTAAAAGAGPTFFADLAGGLRTGTHRPFDRTVGNAVAVTNEHGFGGSFGACGYLRGNTERIRR